MANSFVTKWNKTFYPIVGCSHRRDTDEIRLCDLVFRITSFICKLATCVPMTSPPCQDSHQALSVPVVPKISRPNHINSLNVRSYIASKHGINTNHTSFRYLGPQNRLVCSLERVHRSAFGFAMYRAPKNTLICSVGPDTRTRYSLYIYVMQYGRRLNCYRSHPNRMNACCVCVQNLFAWD